MQFEIEIISALQSIASKPLTVTFVLISLLGSWLGFLILFLAMFFINKKLSYVFAGTFLFGVGFNYVLKHLIGRQRPFVTYPDKVANLTDAMGLSMPSSHAFCAVVIAIFLCYFVFKLSQKKSLRAVAISVSVFMAILVCLSRLYLGMHYLTDILVGILIGAIFSVVGIYIYHKIKKEKHEVLFNK